MTRRDGAARLRRVAALAAVCLTLGGCKRRAIESWLNPTEEAPAGPSLYDEGELTRALSDLKQRVPAPIQALSLLVYPDHVVLQAQDPAARTSVLQYVYRGGTLSAPTQVKLLGTGKLDDNLFPLESVKLETIPTLVREAQAKANIPEGNVSRVLLKRNLPESMDIQFRVFVTSQRRDASIDADQNGKLLE